MLINQMDRLWEGPSTFCMLGIDPGSRTIGFCALFVGIHDCLIKGYNAFTVHADKRPGGRPWDEGIELMHGDRFERMREIHFQTSQILHHFQPLYVSSEAPFFSRLHPNAYEVLVEAVTNVQQAVFEWSPTKPLVKIETTVAKKAIAPLSEPFKTISKGIKDTKEKVRYNASVCPELGFLNLNLLDEHSLDAAVVVYTDYRRRVLGHTI